MKFQFRLLGQKVDLKQKAYKAETQAAFVEFG